MALGTFLLLYLPSFHHLVWSMCTFLYIWLQIVPVKRMTSVSSQPKWISKIMDSYSIDITVWLTGFYWAEEVEGRRRRCGGVPAHKHTHIEKACGNVISGPLNQSKTSYQENVNKIKSRSKRSLRSHHRSLTDTDWQTGSLHRAVRSHHYTRRRNR